MVAQQNDFLVFPVNLNYSHNPAWRRSAPHRGQGSAIHLQRIANIIQSNRVRQMGINKRHHMTPRQKGPALFINTVFFRQLVHKMSRNKIANLLQHSVFFHCWNAPFFVLSWPSLSHDSRSIPAFSFSMGC
jgi:hypothetical protein